MDYGKITLNINRILEEKRVSKNSICKALDIPRSNFNKYCRNDFQRIDAALICKPCWSLTAAVGELIEYTAPEE